MTGGYPIDGKPKEKSEKTHPGIWKRWLVFLIAVVAIIAVMAAVFMGSTPASTSTGLGAPPTNGQQPVIGTATPSPDQKGQETIIDPYGNQVDQKDIIDVGMVPVVDPMDGRGLLPPRLVRAGIIDLQVNVESGHEIVVNLNDAPAQRNTYIRVKVLDQKGVITFGDKNVDYIEFLGKKGSGVGQSIYDHNPRTLSGKIKQMQVLVYFVDNKYQPKTPPKINI